ncbi:hypothetical protein [Yersinia sp. 2541 StPb PI]|uniref:hypothetical protein n=1 Tax=Yersinia sp. 2541 StPb PI TaxID=3117407 RepID=UPI003FA4404D
MISKLIVTIFILLTTDIVQASGQISFSGMIVEPTYRTGDFVKPQAGIYPKRSLLNAALNVKSKLFNVNVNYLNKEKTFAITQVTYK